MSPLLLSRHRIEIGNWGGRWADALVGMGDGFLGGFAGLSGPLPLVWLQLRGGEAALQRATYQLFNIVVLAIAGGAMALAGHVTPEVFAIVALSLPATLAGAWLGARAYIGVHPATFRRVILALLLVSGVVLIAQALT